MFKFINPRLEIALNRIHDLEKFNELLIGSNTTLQSELEYTRTQLRFLQDKILTLAGLSGKDDTRIRIASQEPIQIGNRAMNWSKTRQSLEEKARLEYYENKNKEVEAEHLRALEKEVGIGEEDASKVS